MHSNDLMQLQIGVGPYNYEPITTQNISTIESTKEDAELHKELTRLCPADLWPKGSYAAGCPRPILVSKHHQQQMGNIHEALKIAIIDIVRRWWTDADACFPERMPLEQKEEELLKWVQFQVLEGNIADISERLGSWRPDFMVDEDEFHQDNYRITEINARFSFNGFLHEAYGQYALDKSMHGKETGLVGATDPELMLNGLFDLFRPEEPLHLLKGVEHGIDIHMFRYAVWRRFGKKPRLITPADLRLLPDPQSKSGYKLCCLAKSQNQSDYANNIPTFSASNGEIWEEICQVGLELHQRELIALQPEMLRQISLRCFNDMRTILLVHDKRMLGIIRQELPKMVARRVLTSEQAGALERGIVDTIIPGSTRMSDLLAASKMSPQVKDQYLLKPIRSGKGDGIVFGDEMTPDQWVASLERLECPQVIPGVTCVVQKLVVPRLYDVVLKASEGMVRYPLVGTYHVTNGRLLGLGIWRASGSRLVAVSSGGSWICSVMRQEAESEKSREESEPIGH